MLMARNFAENFKVISDVAIEHFIAPFVVSAIGKLEEVDNTPDRESDRRACIVNKLQKRIN